MIGWCAPAEAASSGTQLNVEPLDKLYVIAVDKNAKEQHRTHDPTAVCKTCKSEITILLIYNTAPYDGFDNRYPGENSNLCTFVSWHFSLSRYMLENKLWKWKGKSTGHRILTKRNYC